MPFVPQQATNTTISPQTALGGGYRDDCPSPATSTGGQAIPWGWVGPYSYTFDLSTLVSQNRMLGVQTAFVDNSNCPFAVILTDTAGNAQEVPAGWQAYLDIEFIAGQQMTMAPDINTNLGWSLSDANPSSWLLAGSVPLQTVVNFFNYRITPRMWKAKAADAPVVIGDQNNPYATPTISDFGLFTCQFVGFFDAGAIDNTNAIVMASNYLSGLQGWNSFAIRKIVAGNLEINAPAAAGSTFSPVVDICAGFTLGTSLGFNTQLTLAPPQSPITLASGAGLSVNIPPAICNLWLGNVVIEQTDGSGLVEFSALLARIRNLGTSTPDAGVTLNLSVQGILS